MNRKYIIGLKLYNALLTKPNYLGVGYYPYFSRRTGDITRKYTGILDADGTFHNITKQLYNHLLKNGVPLTSPSKELVS